MASPSEAPRDFLDQPMEKQKGEYTFFASPYWSNSAFCRSPVYKFRTMTEARHADGSLKSDAERLTEIGRFLPGPLVYSVLELVVGSSYTPAYLLEGCPA